MASAVQMKKLAMYARTSTELQATGLEAQERSLLEYCDARGIQERELYSDQAVSGKLSSRPQFNKMLLAVRAGKIHTVLVYSFSRFARSTRQLIDSLEEFNELGVSFVSLTEGIDTNSPMGRAMFTIVAAMAQLERELTVERVKNGLRNARAKGVILGRPKRVDDNEILRLFADKTPIPDIAKKLNIGRASVYRAIQKGTKP